MRDQNMVLRNWCRDPLWDPSVSWDTSDPSVTECLRDTALAAAPCAALWALAPACLAYAPRPKGNGGAGMGVDECVKSRCKNIQLIRLPHRCQAQLALLAQDCGECHTRGGVVWRNGLQVSCLYKCYFNCFLKKYFCF